jgi:HK97 family phage portal protein
MKNPFKKIFSGSNNKIEQPKIEKKVFSDALLFPGLYDRIILKQDYQLAAAIACSYYRQCPIVFTGIDLIASEIASLEPKVWDKEKKQFVEDHPVLDLLYYPNSDIIWGEFIADFVRYYLITGNNYIIATGDVERPPLELRIINPGMAAVIVSSRDGFAQTKRISTFFGSWNFERNESIDDRRFRYYTNDLKRECYQTKFFNPTTTSQLVYGMSQLVPLFYDIESFLALSRHNLSMLERGARPSGFFRLKNETGLSDKQLESLRAEIFNVYTGSSNAGRTGFFDGDVEFVEMQKNNKDMDWAELRKTITNTMFTTLRIPLPLISPDHMTLSNYEIAKLSLYDFAVLPTAKRLFAELSDFLMHRYPGSEKQVITFNLREITALEPRRNAQLKILQEMNLFTGNELRNQYGAEPLDDGFDHIYMPSTSLPIAADSKREVDLELPSTEKIPKDEVAEGDDPKPSERQDVYSETDARNIHRTAQDDTEDNREKNFELKYDKNEYIRILKLQVNKDGSPRFTEEEIVRFANELYGDK